MPTTFDHPLRVLHITSSLRGGAGLGLRRLHESLLSSRLDSHVLCHSADDAESVPNVHVRPALRPVDRIRRLPPAALSALRIWNSPRLAGQKASRTVNRQWGKFFHTGLSAFHLDRERCVDEADVIHLHWVGEFLDVPSFFRRVRKPIVWTLRDEWPLIGGFHYRTDMPTDLPDWIAKIDARSRRLKEIAYRNHDDLAFVSLSEAMAAFARGTPAGSGREVCVIPNPVDGTLFRPGGGSAIRREFGIEDDATVISFVAQRINGERKGLPTLLSAASALNLRKPVVLCVGNGDPPTGVPSRIRVVCTGPVSEPTRLSAIYDASDVFASPSRAESFGKTLTEALACGVPVVSCPNDGAMDIVRDADGVLSSDYSPESFAVALQEALSRSFDAERLRRETLSRFSPEAVARRHAELYSRLLGAVSQQHGLDEP